MNAAGGLPFFSIIVPAHNEERYLGNTLTHLKALEYPSDHFDVIVVQNGSTDETESVARMFEDAQLRVLSFTESGVSFARNRGIETLGERTDWVVFLDADTLVAPRFLHDLAQGLVKGRRPAAGTTRVRPLSERVSARFWFRVYDGVHALFHNSWALFFVDARIASTLRFNEHAALMEDQQYLKAACRTGSFRFIDTDTVSTSTRRFDTDGWLRPILLYAFVGLLPSTLQERYAYGVVR